MKKGINRGCMPATMEAADVFALAKRAGYDGIELNVEEADPNAARPETMARIGLDASDDDVLALRRAAEAAGLELPSISGGLFWRYPLTSPDPAIRDKGLRIGERVLQIAKLLGASVALVVPGVVTSDVSYRDAYDRALGAIRELAPSAERLGVVIGVENVWNKFLLSPLEFAGFVDAVASPAVGAYFDVGNVLVTGFPHHWIEILGSRIRKVHVKDFRTDVGNIRGFAHLLHGDLDWPRAMAALRAIGYDDYVTTELSVSKFYPEKTIADTASSLAVIFGETGA